MTEFLKRISTRPSVDIAGIFLRLHSLQSFDLPQTQPAWVAACQQTIPPAQQHSCVKEPIAIWKTAVMQVTQLDMIAILPPREGSLSDVDAGH